MTGYHVKINLNFACVNLFTLTKCTCILAYGEKAPPCVYHKVDVFFIKKLVLLSILV